MLIRPQNDSPAKIMVVGIGGGGGNAVNTMIADHSINGVQFVTVNTDQQALKNSLAETKLQIGSELTKGLGSGGQANVGRQAAEESIDLIHETLSGSDMVFITAGMGGGTGTGASPIVAGIAKNLGALTIGVVTKPFAFEGKRRMSAALEGIEDLKSKVDTLIVIPNQRLLEVIDKKVTFLEAMKQVDNVLGHGVRSISDLITNPGMINVDFADVKSVMNEAGSALMGMGVASGENRAIEAARQAINSPLLEISIDGATGILFNITGGTDLSMMEVNEAAQIIYDSVDPNANIIFGTSIDDTMDQGSIKFTVLATGFDSSKQNIVRNTTTYNPPRSTPFQQQPEQPKIVTKPENPFPSPMQNSNNDDDDDDILDRPAFLRKR